MRAAVLDINEPGRWEPCDRKRPPCQLLSNMKNTSTFKSKDSNKVCQIKKIFNCNSKIVAYLIDCGVCGKQCNGIAMRKFCARASNYKNTHNFQKELKLSNQALTFSQTLFAE